MTIKFGTEFIPWLTDFKRISESYQHIVPPQYTHYDPMRHRFNDPSNPAYQPTDICESVEYAEYLLSQFQTLVASTRSLESQFLRQISAIEQYIPSRISLIAPVRRLPPELLGTILDLCIEQPDCNRDRFIISVSHVFSQWRDYILGNPKYWNQIVIPLVPNSMNRTIHWFTLFAYRSSPLPLSIRVSFRNKHDIDMDPGPTSQESISAPAAVISLIHNVANRVEAIEAPGFFFPQLPFIELPILCSAKIHRPYIRGPMEFRSRNRDILLRAPLLTQLDVRGSLPTHVQVPWSQLHKLDIDIVPFMTLYASSSITAINLDSLSIRGHVGPNLHNVSTIQFPTLTRLCLDDFEVLRFIQVKNLRSFTFLAQSAQPNLAQFQVAELVLRHLIIPSEIGNLLRELNLCVSRHYTATFSTKSLIELLQSVPHLESLQLTFPSPNPLSFWQLEYSKLFHAMAIQDNLQSPHLVPHLRSLKLCLDFPALPPNLANMVSSRIDRGLLNIDIEIVRVDNHQKRQWLQLQRYLLAISTAEIIKVNISWLATDE